MSIEVRLPSTRQAPAEARGLLDRLEGRVDPKLLDDARLLVSELVTNSVRHAGLTPRDEIGLSVEDTGAGIRVAVSDPGPGFRPEGARPAPTEESGWGLMLVDRIADRWGVHGPGDTLVWFEIEA
jgi:anti-sigma regulatory factor (Ser/Thr protein kinase)